MEQMLAKMGSIQEEMKAKTKANQENMGALQEAMGIININKPTNVCQ
jgi:hypothetical protein